MHQSASCQQALQRAAAVCKEALSTRLSHQVSLTLPLEDGRRLHAIDIVFDRNDLRSAAAPFLERLWTPLQRLADEYKLHYAETLDGAPHGGGSVVTDRFAPPPRCLSQLVLVGGSTKAPFVADFASRVVGRSACAGVDPEHCVALGAAIHGGLMQGTLHGGLEMSDSVYVKDLQDRVSGFQGM